MEALAKLQAVEAIKQLKARYFRLLDMRDFDAMALVFCRDAVFDCSEGAGLRPVDGSWQGSVGPVVQGRDAIMNWIRSVFANRTSVHHGHCHEIVIDADGNAQGIIAMADYIRGLDRQTPLVHAGGHYHERYRIEDGDWRIASTKLTRIARETF